MTDEYADLIEAARSDFERIVGAVLSEITFPPFHVVFVFTDMNSTYFHVNQSLEFSFGGSETYAFDPEADMARRVSEPTLILGLLDRKCTSVELTTTHCRVSFECGAFLRVSYGPRDFEPIMIIGEDKTKPHSLAFYHVL